MPATAGRARERALEVDMDLWGMITGGVKAVTDIFTGFSQADAAEKNYELGKENLEWQRAMQEESWRRDDTAVQRRMKDLEAAGINPLMAAGSAAGNSPVVHTEAPQIDPVAASGRFSGTSRGMETALATMSMAKDFAVKDAQAQLLQAQAHNLEVDSGLKEAQTTAHVQENDVYELNHKLDLDTIRDMQQGLIEYNQRVFDRVANGNDRLLAQQARAKGERAQAEAMDELTSAGVERAKAEAVAAGYGAQITKNELEISGATVPGRIAGAYADVVGKLAGSVNSLSLQGYLRKFIDSHMVNNAVR